MSSSSASAYDARRRRRPPKVLEFLNTVQIGNFGPIPPEPPRSQFGDPSSKSVNFPCVSGG
jgi:hypothetical protein